MAGEAINVTQICDESGKTVFSIDIAGDWHPLDILRIAVTNEATSVEAWVIESNRENDDTTSWTTYGIDNGEYIVSVNGSLSEITRSVTRSADCQPPQDPEAGTWLRDDCFGVDLYQVLADGSGGEEKGPLVAVNSTQCGYVTPVPGCMDSAATNYNPNATVDDGTCTYPGPVSGCTDPTATNYNPAANQDDGTCTFAAPSFHAVGGVLPNPIAYAINAEPLLDGQAKQNHFIRATIHRQADDTLIGTMQARVRNGKAWLDVSAYLRPLVSYELPTDSNTPDTVLVQDGAALGFYLKYRERFNGIEGEEVTLGSPPRVAVEAALDGYAETLEEYTLRHSPPTDTLPTFTTPYKQPVAFSGLPYEVGVVVSREMADKPLFWERRYLDATGQEIEIRSTAIGQNAMGQKLRLLLDRDPIECATRVELSLIDENRHYRGTCDGTIPVAGKIFDFTFDFTFE